MPAFEPEFLIFYLILYFFWIFADLSEIRPILPRLLDGELVIKECRHILLLYVLKNAFKNVSCFVAF